MSIYQITKVVLAAVLPLQVATPQQFQEPARIEGMVLDGTTNFPLANVTVAAGKLALAQASASGLAITVRQQGVAGGSSTVTDSDGHFVLEGVPSSSADLRLLLIPSKDSR